MAPLLPRPTDGAVVTALTAAAVGAGLLSGTVGLLSGLTLGRALLLAVLVPLALSAAAAAVLGFVMATALDPYPESSSPLASPTREGAEASVRAAEDRLLRAVEGGAGDDELQPLAVSLHRARLALATVVLADEGSLPRTMKDELVVAHRGLSAWVRRGPAR